MRPKIRGGAMAQATRNGQLTFTEHVERALREGAMWTLICVALYLTLALASYTPEDPGWSYVGGAEQVANAGGRAGAWFADVTLYLFGFFAYLLPLMVAFSAWVVFRGRDEESKPRTWMLALRWVGFLITLTAGCGFATLHLAALGAYLPNGTGGGLGHLISGWMLNRFSGSGTELLLAGAFLFGFTLFSGISWLALLHSLGDWVLQGIRLLWFLARRGLRALLARRQGSAEVDLPAALNLIEAYEPAVAPSGPPRTQSRSIPEALFAPANAAPRPSAPEALQAPSDAVMTLSDLMKGQRPVPKEAPRVKTQRRGPAVPANQTEANNGLAVSVRPVSSVTTPSPL